MTKGSLADFAPDNVLLQLDSLADALSEVAEPRELKTLAGTPDADAEYPIDFRSMEVFGVREAKNSFSKLLNDASTGKLHLVAASDGTPVVFISVDRLAEAVASIVNQRTTTIADAIGQLPYRIDELPPIRLAGRAPTRGITRGTAKQRG